MVAAHKNRRNAMKMNKSGFTLVEIMIVVAIIGLLAAIAIPSFVKARNTARTNACINNLRQIDSAKEQWAMAEQKNDEYVLTDADKIAVNTYIKAGQPKCPANAEAAYNYGAIGAVPLCTSGLATHKLAQ